MASFMNSVESVLREYVVSLPMTDVQLWIWILIGTGGYVVFYFLSRFFRISRTRTSGLRTFIGAAIAGFMLSYTLVLLGGVFDKKVLENVVARPAGQTILLLYSMVVIIIALTGLFAGYSRVFKIGNSTEKAQNKESERGPDRQQSRVVGYIIATFILSVVSSVVSILTDIFR